MTHIRIVGGVSRPIVASFGVVLLALLLFPVGAARAAEQQLLPNVHNVFGRYMDLIDELSLRRRVTYSSGVD